jgi:hypothetical protein
MKVYCYYSYRDAHTQAAAKGCCDGCSRLSATISHRCLNMRNTDGDIVRCIFVQLRFPVQLRMLRVVEEGKATHEALAKQVRTMEAMM